MVDLEELAKAMTSNKTVATVSKDASFASVKQPSEAHDRLEEGATLTFPTKREGNAIDVVVNGYPTKALACTLRYEGSAEELPYAWYPQTWLRSYRPIENGKTSAATVTWGGAAKTYAKLAREKGYDAAIDQLLGKSFKATNCREFETRGYNGKKTYPRVFDMVKVSEAATPAPQATPEESL